MPSKEMQYCRMLKHKRPRADSLPRVWPWWASLHFPQTFKTLSKRVCSCTPGSLGPYSGVPWKAFTDICIGHVLYLNTYPFSFWVVYRQKGVEGSRKAVWLLTSSVLLIQPELSLSPRAPSFNEDNTFQNALQNLKLHCYQIKAILLPNKSYIKSPGKSYIKFYILISLTGLRKKQGFSTMLLWKSSKWCCRSCPVESGRQAALPTLLTAFISLTLHSYCLQLLSVPNSTSTSLSKPFPTLCLLLKKLSPFHHLFYLRNCCLFFHPPPVPVLGKPPLMPRLSSWDRLFVAVVGCLPLQPMSSLRADTTPILPCTGSSVAWYSSWNLSSCSVNFRSSSFTGNVKIHTTEAETKESNWLCCYELIFFLIHLKFFLLFVFLSSFSLS